MRLGDTKLVYFGSYFRRKLIFEQWNVVVIRSQIAKKCKKSLLQNKSERGARRALFAAVVRTRLDYMGRRGEIFVRWLCTHVLTHNVLRSFHPRTQWSETFQKCQID